MRQIKNAAVMFLVSFILVTKIYCFPVVTPGICHLQRAGSILNESNRNANKLSYLMRSNRNLNYRRGTLSTILKDGEDSSISFDNISKSASKEKPSVKSLKDRVEVVIYLSLWYFLSAVYNIYNKKALNCLGLPWFVATVQMGTGLLLFIPLWLLKFRESPSSNLSELFEVFGYMKSVALYQTLTHISGVIALGSGDVSFTQVVKASEPVFTAGISAIFQQQYLSWQAYTALIPVCLGVAIASTTQLNFSWYCLLAGIMANIFAAARGVFGKTQMCGDTRCLEQLSPENYYAVLTILSFFMLVPATAMIEGSRIFDVLKASSDYFMNSGGITMGLFQQQLSTHGQVQGLLYSLISGILFYLYNEVSFKTLNKVHPVTHAVSNTVKRIVIILSSVIVFNNKMTPSGIFGACLAVVGVFGYSITQHLYEYKPKKVKRPISISKWASI